MEEIDVLKEALAEYENARRLKHLNQNLYEHLIGSIYCLIKHCEKNNLTLPNRDFLLDMVKNAGFIIDQFKSTNRHLTGRNTNHEDNRTLNMELLT